MKIAATTIIGTVPTATGRDICSNQLNFLCIRKLTKTTKCRAVNIPTPMMAEDRGRLSALYSSWDCTFLKIIKKSKCNNELASGIMAS